MEAFNFKKPSGGKLMKNPVRKSVLLVDDDVLQTYLTKTILSEQYEVTTATNGYEAVKLMEERLFDIVLMDIHLGDEEMDGIKLMKMMRQNGRYKNLDIIAFTGTAEDRSFYLSLGFNEIIEKPVLSNRIFEIMERSFDSKLPAA